jgi:hypothetical protein
MNETAFWDIINSAREIYQSDIDKRREYIENALSKHSIKEIIKFNNISETLIARAKDNGIHEFLCNVFKDEISNNSFDFFVGWLILQGSALYKQTIKDPDFLKEVIGINFNDDFNVLSCEGAKINRNFPKSFLLWCPI